MCFGIPLIISLFPVQGILLCKRVKIRCYFLRTKKLLSFLVGMGHGNEHGHSKMELPDYRQWKIEGTPLEKVQERLAKRGLRDPWAR